MAGWAEWRVICVLGHGVVRTGRAGFVSGSAQNKLSFAGVSRQRCREGSRGLDTTSDSGRGQLAGGAGTEGLSAGWGQMATADSAGKAGPFGGAKALLRGARFLGPNQVCRMRQH